jgi:anti-sigma factor RsiW
MNCEQAGRLIGALHDEELDVVQQVEVESHVRGCAACSTRFEAAEALSAAIRAAAPRYEPPPELLRRLAAIEPPRGDRVVARPLKWQRWAGLAAAAILLLVCGITIGVMQSRRAGGGADALVQDVVAAHVRSLMADHLVDVASSDRHTVKPWFEGKLDFAPPVVDLTEEGFPLIGGRLEYLAGHPAAAIVYRRGQHTINLLVSPANGAASGEPQTSQTDGYSVIRWRAGGLDHVAVSTLNADDLAKFVSLLQSPTPATRPSR